MIRIRIAIVIACGLVFAWVQGQDAQENTKRDAVQYIRNFKGETAGVQMDECLQAIPTGGICDARGYGATRQTIAATVVVGAGKTLELDPSTLFVASSPTVNLVQFEPGSIVRGLTFHCGAGPYAGNVFQNDSRQIYTNGQHTELANVTVDASCGRVTTGAVLSLISNDVNTGIAFLNVHDWRTTGLGAGLYMSASGTGFINGNHFVNMQWASSPAGWHITGRGGSVVGNICSACSYEQNGVGTNGVVIDGQGGAIQNNLFLGDIWDTPVSVKITHPTAGFNMFIGGYFDGVVIDVSQLNSFMPEGSATSQPTAILKGLRVPHDSESGASWETLDLFDIGSSKTPHKYLRVYGGNLQIVNSAFTGPILTLDDSGDLVPKGSVKPGAGVTVSSLPPAASNPGIMVYVTDAKAIKSEGQQCSGGSTNKALAFSNGSVWKCF